MGSFWILALIAAAVVVIVSIIFVIRARPSSLPIPPGEAKPTLVSRVTPPAPSVPTEIVRTERELRARAEADRLQKERESAAQAAAHAADAVEARALEEKAQRLAREAAEAERKAAYEEQKRADAAVRAQRKSETEAREQAERESRERAEAEAIATRRAKEDRRNRLAEAERGRTLAEGLSRTRGGFMAGLNALLGRGGELGSATLAELEEVLFSADIGVATAQRLLTLVQEGMKRKELSDPEKVKTALRAEIARILSLDGKAHGGLAPGSENPFVVMMVGVNGTGKTTSAGKLAYKLTASGKKVVLAAGDTFRAAAEEQLEVWAKRSGAEIVRGPDNADPASVIFESVTRAKSSSADVLIADTAGRLHTKANLMEELKKVRRVIDKAHPGAPHEVLLVVDATTGQNAIAQARQFHEALGVTGIVLTKLDGTAKGGVIIGICDELKIPVRYVGVGEAVGDLRAFDPSEFVNALFEA